MSERELRIGIDIDDVLIKSAPLSIDLYNQSFNTKLILDDWYDFSDPTVYAERWGDVHIPTLVKRVVDTMVDERFAQVEPIDGAQDAVRYLLEKGHKLFAITGRSETLRPQTAGILDTLFPGAFTEDGTFFVDHFEHQGKKATKADVGLELGLTHFIDDLPDHANLLARAGIKTVLLNAGGYKWSTKGIDPAVAHNIVQLDSWRKTVEYLDAEAA